MSLASESPKKRWLITGANGFLGANAAFFLSGRAVTIGLGRSISQPIPVNEFIRADLTDSHAIRAAIRLHKPEVILHTAALASHEACELDPHIARLINVDGTRVVAEAAAQVGCRLIVISTDAVFDGAQGNYSESDDPAPFSVYGETKLLGEQAAFQACENTVVARTNFFGWSPSGSRSILEFFVNELAAGNEVPGFTDFVVTSIYTQHLIAALWEIASTNFKGIINVASCDALSKYDFGVAVAHEFGLNADLIKPAQAPLHDSSLSRRRDISLSVSRLRDLIGHEMPSQQAGIGRAFADQHFLRTSHI